MSNLNTIFLANPRTEVGLTDLLYLAVAAAADGAITGADLAKGWIGVPEAWTYASANTINVPTGATSRFQKGWGVRFKQGGAYKYMYVTTVAAALLTVNGGSDYSVANAAITDIAVTPNPAGAFGFPAYFNYSPTLVWTAGTAPSAFTFSNAVFSIAGGVVTVNLFYIGTAGATVTGVTATLPVNASPANQGASGTIYTSGVSNLSMADIATNIVRVFCSSVSATRFHAVAVYTW